MNRREEILSGVISFPPQIMDILNPEKDERTTELIESFWLNLTHNFLREKSCDSVTWLCKFDNANLFNNMLMHLSKAGWITSTVDNNYAFIVLNDSKLLKWVDKDELMNVKFRYKFIKYRLQATKSTLSDIVKINGKHIPTGLS